MIICFFGFYNKEYSRNRVLRAALSHAGVTVINCVSRKKGIQKYIDLIRQYRAIGAHDAVLVAFPGQQAAILARMISRKKILFDPFFSLFDSLVHDRKHYVAWHPAAMYYWCIDWLSLRCADICIFDTYAHRDFFMRRYGYPKEKTARVLVGSDTSVFFPREKSEVDTAFRVHFHGTNIPLQGVPYILNAAALLEDEHIIFTVIGSSIKKIYAEGAPHNVSFIEDVLYEDLPVYISNADVCLGVFGDTQKVNLVIPNKVYEAWACGRAVITADTPAMRELGIDTENVLLCAPANPEALAEKIRILLDNQKLREAIAEKGREMFVREASTEAISRELMKVLLGMLH